MIPVYGCRFYEDDKLIKNYIPCKTADGVEGMYDTINKEFLDRDAYAQMIWARFSTAESVTIRQEVKRDGE